MRRNRLWAVIFVMCIAMTFPSLAGEWKQDDHGWWYVNDDGTYPVNQWQEIMGKQYYFDGSGYMLENTATPDGRRVGADGALIQTESVSRIVYSPDSVTQDLIISDWIYTTSYGGSTYHVFEITNNSPYTISVNINESAKSSSGEILGAGSTSERDIPSGSIIFINNFFFDTVGVTGFDTTIQTKKEEYYSPVLQNIAVETLRGDKKVIIKIMNNGSVAAQFPEATAVFFKNGKAVDVGSVYLTDGDHEIKPGAVITKEIRSYERFDEVKVHLTARGK